MYTLDALRSNIARLIGEIIEVSITYDEIVIPPKPDMGDLAFGCFKLAKTKDQSPADIAQEIADKFGNEQGIEEVKAQGPYVNFKLEASSLISRVVHEIEEYGKEYGSNKDGKNQPVMVEYANLNSHKEFHIGHLRNILYGLSVHRMLDFAGWQTIPVSYLNDMGANVAKCLWLFVRQGSQNVKQPSLKSKNTAKSPFTSSSDSSSWTDHVLSNLTKELAAEMIEAIPVSKRTGKLLGEIYAEATKLADENDEWKKEISAVHGKIENHDPAWNFLWQETRRWSIQELYSYLQDFGVVIKRQYLESEFIEQSKQVVKDLLDKGIAIESEGAVIIDFDAYPDLEIQKQKLGVMILRKSDGNLLYATKDIPLALTKLSEYPKMALSLLVVDTRQSHYFNQLFAALKIMGYKIPLKHLGYEFVTLPEGAMSSRKGTVIPFQDFIAKVIVLAKDEVISRHKDWNDGKIDHSAWCIAMGGIIFAILKQDPEKIIIFEMAKALRFDGDTGPYVQYAVTRLTSILQKAGITPTALKKAETHKLNHPAEKRLALCLAVLPSVCSRAAVEYKPSLIAQWCLEAASLINVFYRDVKVLDAEPEIRDARLRLVAASKSAMCNALAVLGVPVPDAM